MFENEKYSPKCVDTIAARIYSGSISMTLWNRGFCNVQYTKQ